jgi:CRISPR-associated protein Cas1
VLERYDQALPLLANTSTGLDETKWSIDLVAQLQQGITPQAFTAFKIPKANGKFRLVEKPTLPDLVVLFHLYAQLRDLLDRSFEEESIGFRKGMSRKLALERIQQGIDEGFDVVFESDISDFFPSVDHDILLKKLDALIPKNDVLLKTLLARYLKAPQKIDGQELARNKGLPMGSPLSPLLANVFLDAFDKHIKGFGVKLIRYADDFVILTRGKEVAEALLDDTQDFLHEMALSINLDKTAIRFIDEGFTFLGIHFGQDGEQTLNLSPAADSVRKPLYITEPFTYIGIDGDALEVRKSNTILSRIPLKRVSEVLTLAPASWSSALVAKCTEAGVPIVITSGNGRAIATFAGDSARHYDIAYRQGCYFHAMSETDRLNIAISLAQAKLENSIYFVKQRYRTGTNKVIQKLQSYHDQMASAQDADTVRGYEGAAAKLYFSLLNEWIVKPGFEWKGRNRRPADRINSLLNFGYHLLFSRLNVLLRGEGLNPYLSFLHEPTERYESFVSDIQEVFRVHIDRLVVRLINNSMISATDFVENEAGAWLSAKGKEVFLSAFSRELAHRPSSNRLSLNESMALQVHNWVEFLTEQKTLQLYHLVETKEHS